MEDTIKTLSIYESAQLKMIEEWKALEPSIISKALGIALEPIAWVVRKVIPEKAIQGAIDGASSLGQWLSDSKDLMRDGKVSQICDLKYKDLELSDKLADEVHNWAIGIATAEGAAAGAFGILTAPLDIPAIITLAMRTIHKIGMCYGYECKTEQDKLFVLGILSASGANSMEEKLAALTTLRTIEVMIAKQTWKAMAGKAAQSKLSKEAAIIGIRNLAKQLGVNLTKRKALQAIPAIGALVGASVNGWYIKDVGWAARRAFQERWLIDNNKIIDI
ncbi:EcsC family protein [Paenibacillus sp. V4I5]|uniref:EcsC family protein n=1 Tax=Paenibacillus sp. V4I5 TaxID=3042306 RepID=UPI0027918833|nr:EcsC family protein [Paenibacillus sp. V4I5]MDQ0913944.1 hypothetical protein [Paenibacillus sp. V4I5]